MAVANQAHGLHYSCYQVDCAVLLSILFTRVGPRARKGNWDYGETVHK